MKKAVLSSKSYDFIILIVGNILIIGLGALAYFYLDSTALILPLFLALIVFNYMSLSMGRKRQEKTARRRHNEFVKLFTYFNIYMENGLPVYTALKEAKRFVDNETEALVENLLDQIDMDKSAAPFVHFGEQFDSVAIKQVMIFVYQLVEEGHKYNLNRQFESLFESLAEQIRKEEVLRHEGQLSMLCVSPLVGSAVSMALIALCIVELIGGLVSGL